MKAYQAPKNDMVSAFPEFLAARLYAVCTFVESGMTDQRISVTYLGRRLESSSDTHKKHDIKSAERYEEL
ncbi:hypothetical protein M9194_00700 [Vibrio sp. S4M6]|uniref:hypothetical protein n=1 Tax=Vibrio sinus TaxID=2946865 RepID=UPI00202AB4E9|nr:hypothetical protein [Vibrio sinus]MCL9779950.1 hypothetical protein [Vibrio sinus]